MASSMDDKAVPLYAEVPIPLPYPTSPASIFTTTNHLSSISVTDTEKYPEPSLPPGYERSSLLLIFLRWRIYVRTIALLVTIPSFVLILVGLVTYEKTKASSLAEVVDPYTGKEIYVEIQTKPNVTFAAVGGVNALFSGLTVLLCWKSSKVNHVNNLSNAIVCIIGFAGFASTMGACVYMQQNSELRTTLWEWACDYRGSSDPDLHYDKICRVIDASWVLGLLQAVFDLLTVLLVAVAFSLWKWRLYSRHGRMGRIF